MHVLLVEDNDGDADLVAEAFGEIAHSEVEISRVVRMSVAIERLAARRFDAVLLDLSLPDAAGLDALVQMRTAAPTVPIVVLTGLANAAVGMKAIQHGAQDYLQKGQVAGTELLRAIRYARERSQIVQRAHVLSAVSAAIVGSRDPESVLAALDRHLAQRIRALVQSAWREPRGTVRGGPLVRRGSANPSRGAALHLSARRDQ